MIPIFLFLALGLPAGATAATPEEEEAAERCTALLERPSDPFAARHLYALDELRDWLPPGTVEACLDRLGTARGVPADLARQAAGLSAGLAWDGGDDEKAAVEVAQAGLVRDWTIAGPFVDPRRSPLSGGGTVAEAVAALRAGETSSLPGRNGPVELLGPPAPRADGVVDVERSVSVTGSACALLRAAVEVPSGEGASLLLGGAAELSVWLDPLAPESPVDPVVVPVARDGRAPFRASIPLPARSSRVEILVGICPEGGESTVRIAVGRGRTAVEEAQARLDGSAAGAAGRAPLLDAAELLARSGALPPSSDPPAAALAGVPAEDEARAALILARSGASPSGRQAAAARALLLAPDELEALLAVVRAGRELEGLPGVAEALRRAGEVAPASVRVSLALASDSLANGLPLGAAAWLAELLAASPAPPAVERSAIAVARALGRLDERRAAAERILSVRPRDDAAWEEVMDAAIAAGDADAVRKWLGGPPFGRDGMPRPQPSLALERLAARALLRIGDVDAAVTRLERLAAERPADETAWFDLGWALARAAREGDAERALRRGLALRPTDALARTWIAAREGPDPQETRWLDPGREVGDLVAEAHSRFPEASTLYAFRGVVVTLDSGGGVRERHRRILAVRTGPGADTLEELPLAAFDPSRTVFHLTRMSVRDVDGRARGGASITWSGGDLPDVRLFTPTRFASLSLPRLRAGDAVEVEFELIDVGESFLPAGALAREVGVRDISPTALLRVVGVVPAGPTLLLDAPAEREARTERGTAGERTFVLWEAANVPAVELEALAPPLREVAGAVRLTTFATWENVGGWLAAMWRFHGEDPRLAVRTAGMDAAAIYRDVASTVRYVAAEYGSHGLAPAAPAVVLSRGWGDCKDKTALLIAALDAAGIEAVPALVRTRWAGNDPSGGAFAFPYAFDHVIAYLPPPIDRYVDPTATRLPWDVLPRSDRGAAALVLDPAGPRSVVIPADAPPEEGLDRRDLLFLDPTCEAALVGDLGAGGADAGDLRELLAAPDLRAGILGLLLSRDLPDARLIAADVEGLEPDAARLRVDYVGSVPAFCRFAPDALESPLGVRFDLVERLASARQRTNDLELIDAGFPVHWRRDVQIGLSGSWSWTEWPEPVRMTSPFGMFSMEVRPEGGMLHVSVDLTIPVLRVDVDQYEAFRAFLARVDDAVAGVAKAERGGGI